MQLGRIKRDLTLFWRAMHKTANRSFSPSDLTSFRFFQFRPSTAEFFFNHCGKTDIVLTDTPHFRFASALAAEDQKRIAIEQDYYLKYLKASWQTNDAAKLESRIAAFRAHFEASARRKNPRPQLTQLEPEGSYYVVDGNHRVAFAAALNRDITCTVWPFELVHLKQAPFGEFYGPGSSGIPYQPVYFKGSQIVSGRRADMEERLSLIPASLLRNATILDVASNIGTNSMLARKLGATSCLGLEKSRTMTNQATRLAMFNGLYPHVQFRQFDLDNDSLDAAFDGAFLFSIFSHLKDPSRLNVLVDKHVTKWVVFEGHPRDTFANYEALFRSSLFSAVEEIGTLPESVRNPERNRRLWLCLR